MRRITLRQFRDNIADIGEEVEVQRRGKDGNIQVLGVWLPSLQYTIDSAVLDPAVRLQTPQQQRDAILRRVNRGDK